MIFTYGLYTLAHKGKIIESETIKKGKGGDIILQGDFNARTSNNIDFVESDKFDT